jgi:CRISPR/Cas system CMR-associated protein Cmr1 (group 7 of RAMP superfamily)
MQGMWHTWGEEECIQDLVRTSEGKETARKTGCRLEDNIKMDVTEI